MISSRALIESLHYSISFTFDFKIGDHLLKPGGIFHNKKIFLQRDVQIIEFLHLPMLFRSNPEWRNIQSKQHDSPCVMVVNPKTLWCVDSKSSRRPCAPRSVPAGYEGRRLLRRFPCASMETLNSVEPVHFVGNNNVSDLATTGLTAPRQFILY